MDIDNILLIGDSACKIAFISEWINEDSRLLLRRLVNKNSINPNEKIKIIVKGPDSAEEKLYYDEKEEAVIIMLSWVPLYMQLVCWTEDDMSLKTMKDINNYKKLVFISSWQYQSKIMEKMIKQAIEKHQQNIFLDLLLVLHKSRIRTGYTDMDNPDESFEKAYEYYKNILPVKQYITGSQAKFVFRSDIRLVSYIGQDYEALVKKWLVGIEDEDSGIMLEYVWDVQDKIEHEILIPFNIDKMVTSYKKIQHEKDIMQAFFENFKESLYPKALELIKQFYKLQMNRVVIWDIKQDLKIIESELEKMYNTRWENYNKVIVCPPDEISYNRLAEQTHIKTDFAKLIKDFYQEDVQNFIYAHIIKQAGRIKKQLQID